MTLEEETEYLMGELKKVQAGDAVKLFCFVNDTLAGVTDVHRDLGLLTRRRHGGIFGIIVGKEFRGQGIGRALLDAVIAEAYKNIEGLRQIKLTCFANNKRALALYNAVGFKECGRVPNALFYKGEYVDEVMMVMER